jgi:hypothetical protein
LDFKPEAVNSKPLIPLTLSRKKAGTFCPRRFVQL